MGLNLAINDIDYLVSISNSMFPEVNKEVNKMLFTEYKSGVSKALDNLIFGNFKYILKIANRFKKNNPSFELGELVNEGILGFIKALDKYDLEKGELITYADTWINYYIRKYVQENTNTLTINHNLLNIVNKYKSIVAECENTGKALPSDEELKSILGVQDATLLEIRGFANVQSLSLDNEINRDEDRFSEIVGFDDDNYSQIEDNMADKSLLVFLKDKLSEKEYYILYYRVLNSKKIVRSEIAKKLSITGSRVEQIEKSTLDKVKSRYLVDGGIRGPKDYSSSQIDKFNIYPIDIDAILRYLYMSKILGENEKILYRTFIRRKYNYTISDYANILGVSEEEIRTFKEKIKALEFSIDQVAFSEFKRQVQDKYGAKLLSMDLENLDKFTSMYRSLMMFKTLGEEELTSKNQNPNTDLWNSISRDEAYAKIVDVYKMESHLDGLLRKYFEQNRCEDFASKSACESEINRLILASEKFDRVPYDKLYETIRSNKDAFTLEQYDYLLLQVGKIDLDEFKTRHKDSILLNDTGKVNQLLEKVQELYFGLKDYGGMTLTLDVYTSMRDMIEVEYKTILDMLYGVNSEKMSIMKIASVLEVDYDKAYAKIYKAKRKVISMYLARTRNKQIRKDIYLPYLSDESIDLSENTLKILEMYLVEHKSYEEIAIQTKKTKRSVSNMIMDGLRRIDLYRFGILQPKEKYVREELIEALNAPNISDEEREIIKNYLANGSISGVSEKFGIDKKRVEAILKNFYTVASKIKLAKVEVNREDIEEEIKSHASMRVISSVNAKIMALYLGIKCNLNREGKTLRIDEIKALYPKMDRIDKIKCSVLKAIAMKKLGLARGQYAFMNRSEVIEVMKDKRLPISEKDRETINYAFGIKPYRYMDNNELMALYKESSDALRTRIQRAFLTIFKYRNGEISGKLDYVSDIHANFRYFSYGDRALLEDYYKNDLSYEEIAKKYGMAYDAVADTITSLTVYLKDIINSGSSLDRFFDFDYYYMAIRKPDFPFYGDPIKCDEIFRLYYDKHMNAKGIIAYKRYKCSEKTIYRIIRSLKLATMKRKMGITKGIDFEENEIRDFYLQNKEQMDIKHQYVYFRYFDRKKLEKKEGYIGALTETDVSPIICNDLLKARNEVFFDLDSASEEEIISIIQKYKNKLSLKSLYTLLDLVGLTEFDMMSEEEKGTVSKILAHVESDIFVEGNVKVA